MRCHGKPPSFLAELLGVSEFIYHDPGPLCNAEETGGFPDFNSGGYCRNQGPGDTWRIAFKDYTIPNGASIRRIQMISHRLPLWCLMHCSCDPSRIGDAVVPLPQNYAIGKVEADLRMQLSYPISTKAEMGLSIQSPIDQLPNDYIGIQLRRTGSEGQERSEAINLSPANHIICEGPWPLFELPIADALLRISGVNNLQHLCASAFSLGNVFYNKGGYCQQIRHSFTGQIATVPFYDDDLVPHPFFQMGISEENDRKLRTLNLYCFRNCRCRNPDGTAQTPDSKVSVPWMDGNPTVILPNGGVVTIKQGDRGHVTGYVHSQPQFYQLSLDPELREACSLSTPCRAHNPTPETLACESDVDPQACVSSRARRLGVPLETWCREHGLCNPALDSSPEAPASKYLGAEKIVQQAARLNAAPADLRAQTRRCLGACDSMTTCGLESDCACIANPTVGGAPRMGRGQAVYTAACMNLALLTTRLVSHPQLPKRWDESSEGGYDQEEQGRLVGALDVVCPCNGTYVSQACCLAEKGMVWEDESLKMGVLK
ncbi:MAG: hypothetical protein M1814_005271 [Vezdaea aestivalis]|nr:MAG: hypothetical protein M1814_005271 [Vezdaea aestivalis]